MRTILRVVALLKTLVKTKFDKDFTELIMMQRNEQCIWLQKQKEENQSDEEASQSELDISDVVYYSSDDEQILEKLLKKSKNGKSQNQSVT